MKAPSEKHLENWIFKNGIGKVYNCLSLTGEYFLHDTAPKLVGSQIQVPYGFIDLLYMYDNSFMIVEIKKGAINSKTLNQILRYAHNIEDLLMTHCKDNGLLLDVDVDRFYKGNNIDLVVIGSSIDRETSMAIESLRIDAFEYDFDGESYFFKQAGHKSVYESSYTYDQRMQDAIEHIIKNAMKGGNK